MRSNDEVLEEQISSSVTVACYPSPVPCLESKIRDVLPFNNFVKSGLHGLLFVHTEVPIYIKFRCKRGRIGFVPRKVIRSFDIGRNHSNCL